MNFIVGFDGVVIPTWNNTVFIVTRYFWSTRLGMIAPLPGVEN